MRAIHHAALAVILAGIAVAAQGQAYGADYPPGALARHEEGTTEFRVTVGTDGRAKGCVVIKSSGFSDLDDATCRMILTQGRWKPATDSSGQPIESLYSRKVTWKIPR